MEIRSIISITVEISALVVSAIITVFLLLQNRRSLIDRDILWMIVLTLVLLPSDILAYVFRGDASQVGWLAVRISNALVFLMNYALLIAFGKYICDCIKPEQNGHLFWYRFVSWTCLASMVMILLNPLGGWLYYFDSHNTYYRGPLFVLTQAAPILGCIIYTCMLVINRKRMKFNEFLASCLYLIFPVVGTGIQIIVYGYPMQTIGGVISCWCIVFAREVEVRNQLQAALEEAKKTNFYLNQQYKIVEALSRDTFDGFLVDIQKRTSTTIKAQGTVLPEEKRITRNYDAGWVQFSERAVYPEDQEGLLKVVQLENVLRELEAADEYVYRYRLLHKGGIMYCQVKFSRFIDQNSGFLVFGTSCIDRIIREEVAQKKILEEARNMAEAANRAKSTFLFNMSHDIRTPMNAIVGYTELILENVDDKERCLDYVNKIKAASDFLLSIINNVLEMARIESNRMALDESVSKSGAIVEEVSAIYSELMRRKKITFTKYLEVQTENIYVDIVKVREIILNLVSNAYKYTPEGGEIRLSVRELPCEKEDCILLETTVADTGIGMSQEFLPKLFEEFTRADSAACDGIQGSGLGMAIVKKLVELMDGTIAVESELGKGTTVVVTIPHRIAKESGLAEKNQGEVDASLFVGRRILLAEDNDLNAEIATEILQNMGFLIERAADGIICVDMVRKASSDHFDLILMDVQMPNMDGYRATERIRNMEDPQKAKIPIVAMTANAFEEDRQNAMEVGMNDHLAKPINIPKLMKTLASILEQRN